MTGKEVFKLSCCAAIGWHVGRDICKFVNTAINGGLKEAFKCLAEAGDPYGIAVCDKMHIKYQKNEETYEDKIIGFHM